MTYGELALIGMQIEAAHTPRSRRTKGYAQLVETLRQEAKRRRVANHSTMTAEQLVRALLNLIKE